MTSQAAIGRSGTDNKRSVQLDESWLAVIGEEFEKPYMLQLREFLKQESASGKLLYPPAKKIFNALDSTPFDAVKVVIIGQDPYHGPEQAHGLSFSVPRGVKPPPSLQNIFKELQNDLKLPLPSHGCLEHWAQQGVLLLNAVLTVEHKRAGSHAGKGWERFTDRVIEVLAQRRENLVFLLWGAYAQKKGALIDGERHCVLKSVHPSPLSAHRGFLGCKHFSSANRFLESHGYEPIDWDIN